jgi:hypothetical protein
MSLCRKTIILLLTVVALLGAAAAPRSDAGTAPLSAAEADGYLQWLHSLEQARSGRLAAGQDEDRHLYPFDQTLWEPDAGRPYRHLAISKAVLELESRWNNRGDGRIHSPLLALSHARNYMHLSEYDSAQVWFDVARDLDAEGDFSREIARESLASKLAAGDSLSIDQSVAATLAADDLTGRDGEIILALRRLLILGDAERLRALVDAAAPVQAAAAGGEDGRLQYWRAFSLAWLGDDDGALGELRAMITGGGLSRGLTEGQRSWVLTALADLQMKAGNLTTARSLLRTLGESSVPDLAAWGLYQQAELDFLERNYARAAAGFARACEGDEGRSWRDHACAMEQIADELARIRKEGERYGVSAYANP